MPRATAAAAAVADPPAPGLRQRKKDRVREQLLEAAVKLFSRKGFDATTIDDIVGAVEVSRRTFFRYFETKEDVLPAWFDRHVVTVIAMLEARPAGEDPMTSLRHVLDGLAELYESQLANVLTIERVISREPAIVTRRYARMEDLAERLAAGLAARHGGGAKELAHFRLLARVNLAVARTAVERWAMAGGKGGLPETMRESYRAVHDAFTRRPGGRKRPSR
jgi:AcrR family transcriptional regulator